MNVLFFTRLFYPHIGGVEKHVMEISKLLVKKGYKIHIVTEQVGREKQNENVKGSVVHRIPLKNKNWLKKFIIWKWLFTHRKLIKNANIIHCHDVFFWYLPFRFLYPRKKVFTTFHGYEKYPIKISAIVQRKIAEILSRGNICVGEFIRKWYGTKPTFTIYGGVDVAESREQRAKSSKSAIFIGRLDEQTGIDIYNNAFKLLKRKHKDFELSIYGDGEFRNKLEKDIKLHGFSTNAVRQLPKFHIAFVSRYLSILEALAAKRPVVAVYDNSVKKDYLMMTPFRQYIKIAKTPEEVASHVEFILGNRQQEKQMIENGFAWVSTQTWKRVADLYTKLWST